MIISFITTKYPTLESGAAVRNYYLLKALLSKNQVEKINLVNINLSYKGNNDERKFQDKKIHLFSINLKKRTFFKSLLSFAKGSIPYVDHLKDFKNSDQLVNLLIHSEVVILSELDAYLAAEKYLKKIKGKTKIILDCHNVDHLRLKYELDSSFLFKRVLGNFLVQRLKALEVESVKYVDFIFCCSKIDKDIFSKYISPEKIDVIENGVSFEENNIKNNSPVISSKKAILFMGELSYGPNIQGLKYYLNEIHPIVMKQDHDAVLYILGKNAPNWLITLSKKNSSIQLLGFVPSVISYLDASAVCICPILGGSGTRLKVLEYMARSKPIVSTTLGCQGINVIDCQEILIADSSKLFAKKILDVLSNKELADKLGSNAYKKAYKEYNWLTIGNKFFSAINGI